MESSEVQGDVTFSEGHLRRPKEQMMGASGEAINGAETSNEECSMQFNFVVEDLEQDLQRPEEENQLLGGASNESCQLVDVSPLEDKRLEVQGSEVGALSREDDVEGLKPVAEVEASKAHPQILKENHAQLVLNIPSFKQEDEDKDEVCRLSSQISYLEEQLRELEVEHGSILEKSRDSESTLKIVNEENIKLTSEVAVVLEDRLKREEKLAGMLENCEEHVCALEVKQHDLMSTIETSNAAISQLKDKNASLSSELDHQRRTAEKKISDLATELQVTQDQQLELQLQLQGLREENTHVVIKASKLDQLVEDLKADKLSLTTNLERLVQEKERKNGELEAELRTCKEHVQSLEVEKSTSAILVDSLNTRVQELEEDNKHLLGESNEASQSLQDLWERQTQLIEGYNKLEQDKLAIDAERMELVAGIQTVWEQLHAAHERENLLASDLRELSERRDVEKAIFEQNLRGLEEQLLALDKEKDEQSTKSVETSQALEALRLETSHTINTLQEEKRELEEEVVKLVKLKEEAEQAMSMKEVAWETQIQGLEAEKVEFISKVEDLEQRLLISGEEIKNLLVKEENSNQLIQELREERIRLKSEIDKLEEVKERQEGERLELAAELQAAWDQIQAVRDSEANLATELSEVKDQKSIEKRNYDGLVQEIRLRLRELEEKNTESTTKVEELSKRLNELRYEQELQDENGRLAAAIAMLEQDKDRILTEREILFEEKKNLLHRVNILEYDKNKMAYEIEELNQWLQGPAAEKKQLAKNLDETTQLLKGLEVQNSELQEQKEKMIVDSQMLHDVINTLEEEKAKSLIEHDDLTRRVESLEEEKRHATSIQEESNLSIQNLNEEITALREEAARMISVHGVSLLRIEFLEKEKYDIERALEDKSAELSHLRMKNNEKEDVIANIEVELSQKQMEVELLKDRIFGLEENSSRMKESQEKLLSQLQDLKTVESQSRQSIQGLTDLNGDLMEQFRVLEVEKFTNEYQRKELDSQLVSMSDEKAQFQRLFEESQNVMQELRLKYSELSESTRGLEEELMKRHNEVQLMSGQLYDLKEEKERFLSENKKLFARIELAEKEIIDFRKSVDISNSVFGKLQAENLEYISNTKLLETEMERKQAEVERLEVQMESLSSAHQNALLKLQDLVEERDKLTTSLDASTSFVQKLQADNADHLRKISSIEKELKGLRAQVWASEEKMESLSTVYQDTVLKLKGYEKGNNELVESLNTSNLFVQELQAKNIEQADKVKLLEEEGARSQADRQTLEEQVRFQCTAHQDSLLQLHSLEEEKAKSLEGFDFSIKELQSKIVNYEYTIKVFESEVDRRQVEVQRLEEIAESLSTALKESLLQLQVLKVEKDELVDSLESSNVLVQKLQVENLGYSREVVLLEEKKESQKTEIQLADAARNLEEKLHSRQDKIETRDSQLHSFYESSLVETSKNHGSHLAGQSSGDEEVKNAVTLKNPESEDLKPSVTGRSLELIGEEERQNLKDQVQRSLLEKVSFERECAAKLRCLEEEKSQLLTALEASRRSVGHLREQITSLEVCVQDIGRDGDELANQIIILQERNCDFVVEKGLLLSEMQGLREQLQDYVKRFQESDYDAKKYREEALELAKQLETFKEQMTYLVEENSNLARQLEMSMQLGCLSSRNYDHVKDVQSGLDRQSLSFGLPRRNDDLVKDLEPDLDRQGLSSEQMDVSDLTVANMDPMGELQQAILGWVEIITAVCQELAKLLRSVGEEKEKLERKQGISNQKIDILTRLCQELDDLILGVREKTERFAEELSSLKERLVKSRSEKDPLDIDVDVCVENSQHLPEEGLVENSESMPELDTCQKVQLYQAERTELEAHVCSLSSCLEDSQGQLKALVVKNSTGNPYLLTSRADGDRQGLACFSADGNCVINYGRELKVRRDLKALEHEKKEKKENGTHSTFSQRNQTPARSFKKCKVTMPQPKRRWIF